MNDRIRHLCARLLRDAEALHDAALALEAAVSETDQDATTEGFSSPLQGANLQGVHDGPDC